MASVGLAYHQPLAHYLAGVALIRLGRPVQAEASLLTAVEQHPTFPRAHLHLARLYEGELSDAERGRRHRESASQARRRIEEFRAGHPLPPRRPIALVIGVGIALLNVTLVLLNVDAVRRLLEIPL